MKIFLNNKEIFIYDCKHIERKKVDKNILARCEQDELYENDKPFEFWSNKFINIEMKSIDFKITCWPFLVLAKK